jgi:hypothetical protein
MLGPGRTNLRPGLSCLLDDAGPLVPAHERLHPFCLPLKRLPSTAFHKNERPQDASVRDGIAKRELKFGRLVAVSWKIAVDLETDAHFDKCRSCP